MAEPMPETAETVGTLLARLPRRPSRAVWRGALGLLVTLGDAGAFAAGCLPLRPWAGGETAPAAFLLTFLLVTSLGLAGLRRGGVPAGDDALPWHLAPPVAARRAATPFLLPLLLALLGARVGAEGCVPVPAVLAWAAVTTAAVALNRLLAGGLAAFGTGRGWFTVDVAVVGATPAAARLVGRLKAAGPACRLIGVFDDRRSRVPQFVGGYPVLGEVDDLLRIAARVPVDRVVVALPASAVDRVAACIERLRGLAATIQVCADPLSEGMPHPAGPRLLTVRARPMDGLAPLRKALLDRGIAALGLLLTAPLLLSLGLVAACAHEGAALARTRHRRADGTPLTLLDLTTQRPAADRASGPKTASEGTAAPAPSPLGLLLTRTRLVRLPRLLNVLRGDLAVVGPPAESPAGRVLGLPALRLRPGLAGLPPAPGGDGPAWLGTGPGAGAARRRAELLYAEGWSAPKDLRFLLLRFVGPARCARLR